MSAGYATFPKWACFHIRVTSEFFPKVKIYHPELAMKKFFALIATALLATMTLVGCSSNSNSMSTGAQPGNVFVTGEDAPLPSVVGFNVTINSITLNGASNSPVVMSTPTMVDFARLVGLRSPLAFNSVPADTYASATFVLTNPIIDYVTLNPTPVVTQMPGTLPTPTYSLTVNFPTPMVVGANGLAGLKMDFDIRQSLAVDGNGQITGVVNPVIFVKATHASDPDGQVTDLTGGLVSVATANNSFVMQGPYGRQLTIYVNSSTTFNSGWSMTNLAAPAIVGVQGAFQADGSLLASGVEVITTAQSFISGRVLALTTNGSNQVQQITMWVGETGADMVSDIDSIQTVDVSAVTDYEICFLDGPLTGALFNNTSVEIGQRVFIGGSFVNPTFTPLMISLRRQGAYGMFIPGTVTVDNSPNGGNFQVSNNGLLGYSAGGPVTVNTGNLTYFYDLNGLSALSGDTTAVPLVFRGLFLKDPVSGNPEFFAGFVADPPVAN
jgi:Domain of unknown function (DUF4382)